MSDDTQENTMLDEKTILLERAKMMGISTSNNMKVETLRAKIAAKQAGEPDPEPENKDTGEQKQEDQNQNQNPELLQAVEDENEIIRKYEALMAKRPNPLNAVGKAEETPTPVRQISGFEKARLESMRLIRVRIQNLNPMKADLPGEIVTVGNSVIGTVRRYIPFGEITDNGWHIEKILFDTLKERTFPLIRTKKNKNNRDGQVIVETSDAKEFALEVLPDLTEAELRSLAQQQAAAGTVG